jgi:autotransporter family porin
MISANAGPNSTKPTSSQLSAYAAGGYTANYYGGKWAYARVDGQYSGTTDMIMRWAACKWGIDEDVVRAQAINEHWSWNQFDSGGDKRTSYSQCVNGSFDDLWGYMCSNCCFQTWSIWQTKVYYNWMTWPMIHNSTAFAADFRYADQRACMDGDLAGYFAGAPAYNGHTYSGDIASGNLSTILWGCIGFHYSGAWYNGTSSWGAIWYINAVKNSYYNKPWRSRWPTVNWPS